MRMSVPSYLSRLGLSHPGPPSAAALASLQEAHLLAVPFENLHIRAGRPILLHEEALYEKIVNQRRGGFCYELNGLFAWLLRQLGFTVTLLSARVHLEDGPGFSPEFDHLALRVDLDHPYLVDVGFGDSFRRPIRIPDGETTDISGRYRLCTPSDGTGDLELQSSGEDGWQPQYRFNLLPRQLTDFSDRCTYHQTSPQSSFTRRTVCTIATPAGRLTLTERELTITTGKEVHKTPVPGRAAFLSGLSDHFGLQEP